MEYIQRIRRKVGQDRVLIPASAVVILNEAGQVLLHLRDDSNSWGLPGGLMDIGETVVENACREVREETGLTVRNLIFFGVFSGPTFETQYPNGDQTAPVILGFYTREFDGVPKQTQESLAVQFFPLDALPDNMNMFHRKFTEGFIEFQKSGSVNLVLS